MPSVAPQIARRINDRVAMDLLLREGPMTKGAMRAATGMSQPSVLELFERLKADGLIEPAGPVAGRRGPQAHSFRVNPRRATVAVVRVDPRQVAAGVTDMTGALSPIVTAAPPAAGEGPATRVIETVRRAVRESGHDAPPSFLVVAATGVVDPTTGDVGYVVSHPEWRGTLRAGLEAELAIPVTVENQVNLLGLAELDAGPAEDRDFALLSLGTAGGAAAIILDGRLWRGNFGAAGEVAYLATGADEVELGAANTVHGGLATLMQRVPWPEGAPLPTELVDPISRVAAALCAVVDPRKIVLAGTIGRRGGAELAALVQQRLRTSWPMPVRITTTRVTGDAVLKGAAVAGLNLLRDTLWGPVTGLTRAPAPKVRAALPAPVRSRVRRA